MRRADSLRPTAYGQRRRRASPQISDCRLQIVDWEESEGRMQNEEPNGDR